MTDILDEILAFTEGYQAKRSPPQPRVTLPPELAASLPLGPSFAPSPRGIQQDLNTFSLLRHPYTSKNELVPVYQHPDSHSQPQTTTSPLHDPAAAAISAAISTCIRPASIPVPTRPTRPPPPSHCTANVHSDFSTDTNPNLHHSLAKSFRPVARPRHSLTYQTTSTSDLAPTTATTTTTTTATTHHTHSTTTPMCTMPHSVNAPTTKRSFTQAALHTQPPATDKRDKKPKTEAAVVMPPSAKSILERREKAIREGRRKDAKLTEAERRILRRLRNRESAERCRLRRVQQAALLEKKIENMQVENRRLVAQAEEYQKTIQRLERVIKEFSAQKSV